MVDDDALQRLEELDLSWPMTSSSGAPTTCCLCELNQAVHSLTDATLAAIAERCPLLRLLGLSGTSVTEYGVRALLQGCRQLQNVDLASCRSVSRRVRTAAHASVAKLEEALGLT